MRFGIADGLGGATVAATLSIADFQHQGAILSLHFALGTLFRLLAALRAL